MNRIVVITGATSGYGLATAKKFTAAGDTVVAVSRNAEKVAAVVRENGFADGYTLDVTDYAGWVAFKKYMLDKYGRVDVLVNNAGGGVQIAPLEKFDKETVDKTISLNLNSVIYACTVFADLFKTQKSGTVINITSVCARHCWSEWSVYAAAKAGVLNFTKSLYVELRPFGARATCVIPAAASTGFQKGAGIGEVTQSLTTEDIASAVFFAADMPQGAVVQDMTVWGMSQEMDPI